MSGILLKRVLQLTAVLGGFIAITANAANVAVVSNSYFAETAADYNSRYLSHTFTGIDANNALTLGDLAGFDAVLLFEDGIFSNSNLIGDVVAEFANTRRPVVLGTFYSQDRSDSIGSGWGDLEDLDPNTTDGEGTSYDGDVLDNTSIVPHPLTAGVSSLFSDSGTGYSGGNQAKPDSIVLAWWSNDNALGNPDPAIAYRITGNACVTHLGIIPHYDIIEEFGVDFGGDYFQLWGNAMDFAASGCEGVFNIEPVPTMNSWAIILLTLMLGLIGVATLPRQV